MDDPNNEAKADAFILSRVLEVYHAEAAHALACLREVGNEIGQGHRKVLVQRWTQIRELVTETMKSEINAADAPKFLDDRKT